MLILLPPSEGKTAPSHGGPLDLDGLTGAAHLTAARAAVLGALAELSAGGPAALGLSEGMTDEVAANTRWRTAHAGAAARVYTGVLYAAAGLADLTGTAKRRRNAHVRISSAAYGLLSPADRIPAYRIPPGTKLPGIGEPLPHLAAGVAAALDELAPDVVVDGRSGTYAGRWKAPGAHVEIKPMQERDGRLVSISHFAKHSRGVLAHHLLTRADLARTPEDVAAAAEELVGSAWKRVELIGPTRSRHVLRLVLD